MITKLKKTLKKDKGFYFSWQSNIAMAFYDEYRRTGNNLPHKKVIQVANKAAKNFLNLLIKENDERSESTGQA